VGAGHGPDRIVVKGRQSRLFRRLYRDPSRLIGTSQRWRFVCLPISSFRQIGPREVSITLMPIEERIGSMSHIPATMQWTLSTPREFDTLNPFMASLQLQVRWYPTPAD